MDAIAIEACPNHPEIEQVQRCARCTRGFCTDCYVALGGQVLCAGCKLEAVRDLQAGVRVELELASTLQRFGAVFLDSLLFMVPYVVWVALISLPGQAQIADSVLMASGCGVISYITLGRVLYEGLMLQSRGQTLGKMAMHLKVVTPEGADLRPGQAWGRAFSRFFLDSCISIINYLPAFFTLERTCLHDRLAGTRVIRFEK